MNLDQLQPYLSPNALKFIQEWIKPYPLTLKITRSRETKLGDYRKINQAQRHQITVNGDLNKEAFFFVFTHEIAHMIVYAKFAYHEVMPHGKEWKIIFGKLLVDSLSVYSDDLKPYILKHAKSPKASVGADPNIAKYLINDIQPHQIYLDELPLGARFLLKNRIFIKMEKQKLRYICCDEKTNKKYLVNASTLVEKR
ncbi:hypothetical protein [Faecalibacter sp. LW9]|uniref:hypothetical protein n=1 Tax=Faecalibacter sp. LW9 TaxID=3103144 RepID=UPI002AFF78CA|nr:hypothetical protein [Faecalibacter sp. LW9]